MMMKVETFAVGKRCLLHPYRPFKPSPSSTCASLLSSTLIRVSSPGKLTSGPCHHQQPSSVLTASHFQHSAPLSQPPSDQSTLLFPALWCSPSLSSFSSSRFFALFHHNIKPSKETPPASEKPTYLPRFDQAEHESLWHIEKLNQVQHSRDVKDISELVEPVNEYSKTDDFLTRMRYWHYNQTSEPTFPKTPDLEKGELASGATVTRTTVWHEQNTPAIISIAKFAPSNFRPIGYAENVPDPDSVNSDSHPDFREYRLPQGHADRRPFMYFISASYFFIGASMIRSLICKTVSFWWVSKDMMAMGTTEVDLRPIEVGQTAIVKWRGKPVFVRHRTPQEIEQAKMDDALVGTMKDPQTDGERCPRPEWLINIGVCTHLGCIPAEGGSYSGWFCPCHGSHYDISGRIRQGPAPSNLELPPTEFLDESTVKLG